MVEKTPGGSVHKALLACGAVGSLLFIVVFLVEGATREGYSALRYPISSLAIGPDGWMQVANFISTGLFFILFALGMRRSLPVGKGSIKIPLLIALAGTGLMGAGVFSTDPIYGYPENAPLELAQYSLHGKLHNLFSMLFFVCLPWLCFVWRKRLATQGLRGAATYSIITAAVVIAAFVMAGAGFSQRPGFVNLAGLFQRLSVASGMVWMAFLSVYMLRQNN